MNVAKVGTGISLLCAVHCAALPLLAGASSYSHQSPGGAWLEGGLVGAAALIGYLTLGFSFRQHRRPTPLVLLTLGLVTIMLGHSAAPERLESAVAVAGALMLVAAQLVNRRCPAPCCAGEPLV